MGGNVVQIRHFSTYNVKQKGFSISPVPACPVLRPPSACQVPASGSSSRHPLLVPAGPCLQSLSHVSPSTSRGGLGTRLGTRALKGSLIGSLLPFLSPSCCRWLAKGTQLAFAPEPQPSLGVGCSARGCEPLLVFAASNKMVHRTPELDDSVKAGVTPTQQPIPFREKLAESDMAGIALNANGYTCLLAYLLQSFLPLLFKTKSMPAACWSSSHWQSLRENMELAGRPCWSCLQHQNQKAPKSWLWRRVALPCFSSSIDVVQAVSLLRHTVQCLTMF